jgi:hypothetical protein
VAADVEVSINDEEKIGHRPHRTPVAVRALLGENNYRRKRNPLRNDEKPCLGQVDAAPARARRAIRLRNDEDLFVRGQRSLLACP